ncbi:hypothetical protein DFH27DRAFT_611230 [Peziza echinospora]|nr:hypothetical protein DFH27DRAFT_611230 [Peziza echinospora]
MPAWSDSERNKMFLAMIELMAPHGSNNKLPSWTLVAERMESGFTGEAVRQQFQKCRKEGLPRHQGAGPNRSSSSLSSSSSNSKNKNGRASGGGGGGGKRKRVGGAGDNYDDDDEDASLYSSLHGRRGGVKMEDGPGGKVMMMGTGGGHGNGYGEGKSGGGGSGHVMPVQLKRESGSGITLGEVLSSDTTVAEDDE